MLKFIRKYQLIFLAIGGSLLMVVFLLQPMLQNFAPNPAKERAATVGPDERTVTRGDLFDATQDISIFETLLGRQALAQAFGMERETATEHWYLLKLEATQAGLIGETADGRLTLLRTAEQFANQQFQQQAIQRIRAGEDPPSPEQRQQLVEQARSGILSSAEQVAAQNRVPVERVYRAFSALRGVERLVNLYSGAPRYSERRARLVAAEQGAEALADYAIVRASAIIDEIGKPTDDQLREHVDRYDESRPGDPEGSELGFGYLQPKRIKLEYLHLDAEAIRDAVEVDRVELRKRWRRENPDAPESQFEEDRQEIERTLRNEQARDLVDIADQVIRGELLKYLREIEQQGTRYLVPDDWPQRLPDLEALAQRAVTQVQERTDSTIPAPTVVRRTDAWLTSSEIARLPGLRGAAFRIANREFPVRELPEHVPAANGEGELEAQIGIPQIDPYATDDFGGRFYITVLDAKAAGPPESIDVVRERATENWRIEQAYQRLRDELPRYESIVQSNGLEALASLFEGDADETEEGEEDQPASPAEQIRQSIQRDRRIPASQQVLGQPIVDAARQLDPLASPGEGSVVVGLEVPQARGVVVAVVKAFRPATEDFMRTRIARLLQQQRSERIAEIREELGDAWPFTYPALAERNRFEPLDDEDEA